MAEPTDAEATGATGATGSADLPSSQELRELAVALATAAGALVREARTRTVEVAATKSTDVDVVTRTDTDSEALLHRMIAQARPQDGILGEEGTSVAGTSGLTWVLDPVDGTVNFLYDVAPFAVSVAVCAGPPEPGAWTLLAGAVHDVPGDRTWSAARDGGAYLDEQRIPPVAARPLGQSLVGTGFGYDAGRRAAQAEVLTRVLPEVRDIRRLGSAAIDLCLVASGRLDLYYERGLNPWDMAAGELVATESGAVVRGLGERPADARMTVAGPAESVDALARILEQARADEGA
ncbi:inositol monophosphatase family protein [Paraoerskovia sediminicola]|uniref:inositol monophosphatase family protein n=1 Tax=Paraoerskovia sediminicola TaxID=1138587 RepID=UPI0033063EE4